VFPVSRAAFIFKAISIMFCGSAAGEMMPPMVVYKV